LISCHPNIDDTCLNPAKLDSFQYPPEGYSVQYPLGVYCLPDGYKTLYSLKDERDILSNSPHASQISTPIWGINSNFESPLQEGINAAKQVSEPVRLRILLGCSNVSDRGSNVSSFALPYLL